MKKSNQNLSFKKIKKIYHEEVKQEPVVVEEVKQLEVLPELAPIVEEKEVLPEPKVEVVEGNEGLVNEFLLAIGAQGLVEVVSTPYKPKVKANATAFVDPSKLDDFLKNIQEEEVVAAPVLVEQPTPPTLVTPVTKQVVDLTKPITSKKEKSVLDPNIKAINDRLGLFEKRLGDLAMRPGQDAGGGETRLRFLDDIDRSTIGDGKYLNYNETTQKFQFSTISGGGAPQVQSDWTQSNNTEPSFIKNKPTFVTDITSVDNTVQISANPNGTHDLSVAASLSTSVDKVFAYVTNNDSVTILKGQPVYLYRATGNRPSVILARNTSDNYSAKTLGLASQDIPAGNPGWVQTQGVLTGVDTKDFTEGDTLYLGATAGSLTNVKPYAPNHLVYIGVVVRANQGAGQIYIKPQNGYELDEIHDADIGHTRAKATGQTIVWNNTRSVWENNSYSYTDLTNKPTNVSSFTNDSGYLTSVSWSQVTGKPQNIVTLNDTDVITNGMLVNDSITIGSTAVALGSSITTLTGLTGVTSNHTTAFIAGDNAISGVALQIPSEGAIRNLNNGANNNMYFDVSVGGSNNGQFQFRSSNSFTNVLTMSPTAFNVNPNAVVTSRTPSFGRTAWNSAIDTELTIDDIRFRISNQGGIYPQVIGNGSSRNLGWTGVGAISGSAVTQVGSTGTIVASNVWTTLYNAQGMNSAGDTVTVTLQDKGVGRIYRITFIRSDNGSTTGYNIIAERLL